jgi:hypothetical protein
VPKFNGANVTDEQYVARRKAGKVSTMGKTVTSKAGPAPSNADVRAMDTEDLLALREATPRAELKLHYAIRRALRGAGYYISQNR